MNIPMDDRHDLQLEEVLSAAHELGKPSLEELSRHNSKWDVGTLVNELVTQGAVTFTGDQRVEAAFARPPNPPGYFESTGPEWRRHREPRMMTDPRGAFLRDRERVLFSAAFRRLARVTQVFPVADGAAVSGGVPPHNRITHSIKAAHIARCICQRLNEGEHPALVNADATEAAALAHDLGHPPFGHAGEEALNECVGNKRGGFEGNAQTFRVLTRLERIRPGFPGLNLTKASLNAVIKYPWFRQTEDRLRGKKWNAYRSEELDFQFARDGQDQGKSPEAKVMELADDIAYGVHDLEDGIREGLIPIHELTTEGAGFRTLIDHVAAEVARGSGWTLTAPDQGGLEPDTLRREEQVKFAVRVLRLGGLPLKARFEGGIDQHAALRRLTTLLHQRYLLAVTDELRLQREMATELSILKQIMGCFVFGSLQEEQKQQKRRLRTLFDFFVEEGRKEWKRPEIFSQEIREAMLETDDCADPDTCLARAAADEIASMTEDELLQRHRAVAGASQ